MLERPYWRIKNSEIAFIIYLVKKQFKKNIIMHVTAKQALLINFHFWSFQYSGDNKHSDIIALCTVSYQIPLTWLTS